MRHVNQHCTVAAEDGMVVLECGHALGLRAAKVAANRLGGAAEVAQDSLPPAENKCCEGE